MQRVSSPCSSRFLDGTGQNACILFCQWTWEFLLSEPPRLDRFKQFLAPSVKWTSSTNATVFPLSSLFWQKRYRPSVSTSDSWRGFFGWENVYEWCVSKSAQSSRPVIIRRASKSAAKEKRLRFLTSRRAKTGDTLLSNPLRKKCVFVLHVGLN